MGERRRESVVVLVYLSCRSRGNLGWSPIATPLSRQLVVYTSKFLLVQALFPSVLAVGFCGFLPAANTDTTSVLWQSQLSALRVLADRHLCLVVNKGVLLIKAKTKKKKKKKKIEVHRRQVWCKSDAATLRVASPQLLPSRAALKLLHLRCTERVQLRAVSPGEGKSPALSPA